MLREKLASLICPEMAERARDCDLANEAVRACREWTDEGLGMNCTFVDDDMRLMVGLAQRAILAGLASDAKPDTLKRMMGAAEPHRASHEKALGRKLSI